MIRIFKDEHEIEVVKETLTLTRDNRFMDNDFKIQSNSYPFMIIENEATRLALGSNISTSKNREQFHEVQVITPEGNFVGELQILTYTKNFRKCNLRFFSPLYTIKDEKINSFLPELISTHPTLIPDFGYEEKRNIEIPPALANTWNVFGADVSKKGFPETFFNLPTIYWKYKFGEKLDEDDDWFNYRGVVNEYVYDNGVRYASYNGYLLNNGVQFYNVTVNAPKVYLLAPILAATASVGYKLTGSFVESEFVKKILLDSENDNLTEIELEKFIYDIPTSGGWVEINSSTLKKKIIVNNVIQPGRRYRVDLKVKKILNNIVLGVVNVVSDLSQNSVMLFENVSMEDYEQISVEINGVSANNGVNRLEIEFYKIHQIFQVQTNANPLLIEDFKLYEIAEKKGFSTHPVINLQRFCPDWSFADYLNECKKLFNLKITTNDHEKTLNIDFFEDKFTDYSGVELESILIDDYDSVEFDSILLKYDNVHDDVVFVDKNEIKAGQILIQEHTKEVPSKFKYLPVEPNKGLSMSDFIDEKGGVGLLIYDHSHSLYTLPLANYTSNEINYDLTLQNIFVNFHRKSFSNYLSGGVFPAKSVVDERTIKNIALLDFVFIDNKRYYVNSMKYKELSNGLFSVDFELLLMLY